MHTIEIYNIEGQNQVTMGGACGSCSSGCEPVTHSISETINTFKETYNTLGTINRYQLNETNLDEVADKLQVLYQNSGERLIITASNVKYILGKLTPIIAIDGKLAANNYVPDADELVFAIEHNGSIYGSVCN